MASEALARALRIAEVAAEKKGEDILVLDLRELTLVTDYFVICTGTTTIQIRAIAEAVEEAMSKEGRHPLGREGLEDGRWVLLDYGDVVVHLFAPEERKYYKLERLWGDAERVDWEQKG
ncbi:MAG: ribosome silencing factor [Armatimonadota bacterium]|nr:ribosome silencing factor [Armatimonadota bacterium]MDR5702688.1 ribosome silencing factor [Armatimonadota bacterium]MDR7433797.1 ribosome silencing factor [Armatimonadota bacterium]